MNVAIVATDVRLGSAAFDFQQFQVLNLRNCIEESVARVFAVSSEDMRGPSRGRARVAFARQVAMYLAHVTCEMSLTDVGRLFDRDRTTVAHACIVVEDRRDDPALDRCLDVLESIARGIARFAGRQHDCEI